MRPTKPAMYSSRTADKFVVRLPDGMREKIAAVARDHHRSMNSEIIARLDRSLNDPSQADEDINMIDLPVDPWTPVEGMLVTYRTGQYAGDAFVIHGFTLDKNGKVAAELFQDEKEVVVSFSHLKPYLVV